jgi:transcriptional regulator with XRE-family HTH domain
MRTNLQEARTSQNLYQKTVAEHLGIATNHYQQLEYGKSDTSSDNWLKLFEYFGRAVPLDKLMLDTPKPTQSAAAGSADTRTAAKGDHGK